MPDDKTKVLEDVRIIFRNFAGKEGMYNREGDRNFAVILNDQQAEEFEREEWNVKHLKAREEGDEEQPYLPVSVNFKGRPPRINLVTSRGRTTLNEDEVEILDWVDIINVDLTVRPYEWNVNGKSGKKAYLQTIFVTIAEDPLEGKYAELDSLPSSSGRVSR